MKRFGLVIVLSALLFGLSGCSFFEELRVNTKESVSFYDYASVYEENGYASDVESVDIDVYFYDKEEVPYMLIDDFINISSSMINSEDIYINHTSTGFSIDYNQLNLDVEFSMVYDFEKQDITVNHFEMFGSFQDISSYELDYLYLLENKDKRITELSDTVTFSLNEYMLEGHKESGTYALPISLLNLMFSSHEAGVYFNGNELYAVHYSDVYYTELYINGFNYWGMPYDLKENIVYFMAFYFDNFYGLNNANENEFYLKYFLELDLLDREASTQDFFKSLDFALKNFDDMHLWLESEGYYDESYSFDDEDYTYYGRSLRSTEASTELEDYCNELVSEKLNDDITVIAINEFGEFTPDTFAYQYDLLVNEDTTDIVIDLSCNMGGYMSAVLDLLPYFQDGDITVYQKNFKYDSSFTYTFESDIEKIEQRVYVKTSAISYSAANIFASYMKSNDFATIIGHDSTGGSSYTDTVFAPGGVLFTSPTVYHFTDNNGRYYEYGTRVDKTMNITDKVEMITYINSLNDYVN